MSWPSDSPSTCPWCGSHAEPVTTADHLDEAEFVYSSPKDPHAVARNPWMCPEPECHGVGGFEDFYTPTYGVEEQALNAIY